MAKRPGLPLEDLAAIERARELIRQHAIVTWKLLFGIESLGPSNPGAPGISKERKPASLKLELREYACALFNFEAQQYARRAASHEELRASLEIVADCIETEVIAEIHAPSHDFHCAPAERQQTIRDALKERIQYWLSVPQKQNQKPVVSRAPQPPPPVELGGGMRFSLPGQKAFDTTEPPGTPSNAPGARLKEYREEAGLTQEVLAELIGVSARSVKRHEAKETAIRPTNRRAYERELSKSLGRKVTL
jgi:hypothetical protein